MKRISDFYALKNGSWSAKVSPGSGGNIIELKNGNETILRPLLYEEEKTIDPFRHGAAILLPSNRTDKAAFEYKGEKYSLPVTNPQTGMNLHGGINQQKFTVVHSDASSVCLEMQSTPEIYPFEFSLQVLYRLKTDGCHATYTLSNQS